MEIRPAEVSDARALAAGMKAVVDEGRWLETESDRPVEQLTEMFRSGLEDEHILFVVVKGGEIVGSIGIHPTRVHGVHSLGMWMLRDFRGQGWGRRLVQAALDEAQARGVRKVELEVFPDNGRAIALYTGCGFEIEGLKRDHYPRLDGTYRSAVLMARFLDPPLGGSRR
jgi:ribosomal protein S18 acetylase RimI-like enzyme